MTEAKVGFLCKAASTLQHSENRSLTLLRSYYLMRCKETTRGFGLPEKQFSSKVRCANCCIEWKKGTNVTVKPIKLTKKQRRRIRSRKVSKINKDCVKSKLELLNSNEMEQICILCKHSTVTPIPKAEKFIETSTKDNTISEKKNVKEINKNMNKSPANVKKLQAVKKKDNVIKKPEVNVYSATEEIFLLNNKKNIITKAQKDAPKVIKNNKKKKDKFAGLCQKAVLSMAKLKEMKDKQNKLNLFLKPSP
ncbi:uncharacterized protein LOC113232590 [Hyposmocoma kahamanoa]|uniref:uncharacterized protein LOC113232590 n=1 Tax=Hyposmocoma kahamanoa TaxID=1477025 RepID=UPI000E6D8EFE|nr:uncharacterized protein LOC113232590 [Hyposmocoma kahamanoa]